MKFTYDWKITDLEKVKKNGKTVFSCFACGGGSSWGYKMSGFTVLGCNEIDPEMNKVYLENHKPRFNFLESIETFKLKKELPQELLELDILDGSPPCSSFSMSGNREKDWGKDKKFREGQANQVLDDLFYHYIDLAEKLKPKVIMAENVKGMLAGNAKGYVKNIIRKYQDLGYDVQLFLLNGATMGLPQRRERVFFICRRKDLNLKDLVLDFKEKKVTCREAFENKKGDGEYLSDAFKRWWVSTPPGKSFSFAHPKGSYFNSQKLDPNEPAPTMIATGGAPLSHWNEPRKISVEEMLAVQSFPQDYNFCGVDEKYVMGMSVPPLMIHKISEQIYEQWFS